MDRTEQTNIATTALRDLALHAKDEAIRLRAAEYLLPIFYCEGFVKSSDLAGLNAVPISGELRHVVRLSAIREAPDAS